MNIDIQTASFLVYRSTSRFTLLQRYRLYWLIAIIMMFLIPFFAWAFTSLFEGIVLSKVVGWMIFFAVFVLWVFIGYLFYRLLYGKLHEIGRITFAFDGIELNGFVNKSIRYNELIYLSSDYERPENQYQKHPPAKTYLMNIVTEANERFSFVVSRLSTHPLDRLDLIDILQNIRQQNHHLYKALRGVKRDYTES